MYVWKVVLYEVFNKKKLYVGGSRNLVFEKSVKKKLDSKNNN